MKWSAFNVGLLLASSVVLVCAGSNSKFDASVAQQNNANADPVSKCKNIVGPPNLVSPGLMGSHFDAAMEWWWWLGTVEDVNTKRRFGLDLSVLRQDPSKMCLSPESFFYHVDFTVADHKNNKFHQAPFNTFGNFVNASDHADNGPMYLISSRWHITSVSDTKFHLVASNIEDESGTIISFDLIMEIPAVNGNVPMADRGYESVGPEPEGAAHVDQPVIKARGILGLGNEVFEVAGQFWLQHMWMSNASYPSKQLDNGWDWSFAQLDNGWGMAFTHIRQNTNEYLPRFSYGNVLRPEAAGGGYNTLLSGFDFDIQRSQPWTSPHTNVTYWMHHHLKIPKFNVSLEWHTLINDNEIRVGDQPSYYEGASEVYGVIGEKKVRGVGFTEMVGLGGTIKDSGRNVNSFRAPPALFRRPHHAKLAHKMRKLQQKLGGQRSNEQEHDEYEKKQDKEKSKEKCQEKCQEKHKEKSKEKKPHEKKQKHHKRENRRDHH